MYSTYNEGNSVVAERFIRSLKNKIYKHMTAVSRNAYFDVLDDIVDKYNNTYHKTIGMKPIDVSLDSSLLNTMKNLMKKTLNCRLVIMSEYQSTKILLLKHMLLIGVKRFLS